MTKKASLKRGCSHTVMRSPYECILKKKSNSRRSVQSDALTLHQLTLYRSTALDPRRKCTPLRKMGLSVCKERGRCRRKKHVWTNPKSGEYYISIHYCEYQALSRNCLIPYHSIEAQRLVLLHFCPRDKQISVCQ